MILHQMRSAVTTLNKCIPCICHRYGGVTTMRYISSCKVCFRIQRKSVSNLNCHCHVRTASLNTNLQLGKMAEIRKNNVECLAMGKKWFYEDMLHQMATNNNLLGYECNQVRKVHEVPETKLQKQLDDSLHDNLQTQGKATKLNQHACSDQISICDDTSITTKKLPNGINIQQLFPKPLYLMNYACNSLAKKLNNRSFQPSYKFQALMADDGRCHWKCTFRLKWPKILEFSAIGFSKKEASNKACLQGLEYLYNNGYITKNGLPVIQPSNSMQDFNTVPIFEVLPNFGEPRISRDCFQLDASKLSSMNQFSLFREITDNSNSAREQIRWYSTTNLPPIQKKVAESATLNESPKSRKSPVDLEEKKLQKLFPGPKYSMNHVYITLAQHFNDKSYQVSPRFQALRQRGGNNTWECIYNVKWPKLLQFSAVASTKQDASNKACMQALHYLYMNGHITNKNLPVIPGQEEEVRREREHIETLFFKQEILDSMKSIVHEYEKKMLPHLQPEINCEYSEKQSLPSSEEIWPVYNEQKVPRFRGVEYFTCREGKTLPISNFKENIIKTVNSSRVVIIKGEPGCGKSTRVPQYLLEGWARDYQAGRADNKCRIIVTQPRRIAAISLAERVASERAELPGATIGYQVRLQSKFNRHTGKILYCTTGILLRRLQSDPGLSDCTHIILDEAHERDVNTDLLLTLLKGALDKNPNLKLLVMSATIKAEVFQEYFNLDQENQVQNDDKGMKAEVVHVPGFTFPVKTHFLDGMEFKKSGLMLENTLNMTRSDAPNVVYEDVVKVLKYIHKNRPEGAILVFLPGWEDIVRVKNLLPDASKVVQVLCLHSRMPDSEQRMIFHKFPPGVRKIILATNIAETSVTIDDVGYVVDTGIQKENRFDVEKGINIIDNHWISKASSTQRKGRAGRVQAGEAFLLYPESKYGSFHDYSLPEIQRTSLTKIVLDSKVYSNNMKAAEFLGQLITPPEETTIDRAVDELVELELLDEAENLTPLGRVISDFQLEPKLAKALVNSVIYKCVTPVVDIVTYFSAEMEVFGGGLKERESVNKLKRGFSASSDHLSMMRLVEQWLDYVENGDLYEAEKFCRRHNILDYKLRTLQQLRSIHFDYLQNGLHDSLPLSDDFSDSDELVKAVLLSGVGTVLQHRDRDIVKGKLKKKHVLLTRHNHKATISSESVNYKRGIFPSNFLLYINETRSNVRRMTVIRETSLITPLTVLLFKNTPILIEAVKYGNTENLEDPVMMRLDGTKIAFLTEREDAILLQKCKEVVNAGVDYYIYQLTKGAEYDRQANDAWDGILKKLNTCLRSEAHRIAF